MWEKETEPVYTLANCELPTPIAAVTLQGVDRPGYTVELFASNAPLGAGDKGPTSRIKEPALLARGLGLWVGKDAAITKPMLDSLDFRGLAVPTGVSREPTIVSSFIDPHAEDQVAAGARTVHVFAIGDKTDMSYKPTFAHVVNGPAAKAEFRRYIDHLDIDNDGVDEIVLEGWQYGGDTFLSVLGFRDGRWTEIFRSRPGWCLDSKK
jgi:hypothetical protein